MPSNRVVVTGLGALTPVGNDIDTYFANLISGVSGIAEITLFDASEHPSRIAGEVKNFDPETFMEGRRALRMDRGTQFAVAAAKMAVEHSGLTIDDNTANDIGVIIGSGIGGLRTLEDQHKNLVEKGPRRVSPFLVPMMISDMAAGQVSIELGAKGPNWCPVSACASGAHAIGEAFETIKRGAAKAVITGGTEAPVTPLGTAAFASARALSTRNDEPEKASRPFDRDRDGFVIAEGAGIVILEDLEYAKARGATIYAEVIGYGATGDAYHMTAPDPQGLGASRGMQIALDLAGLKPENIDYVNAHGTSTPMGDEYETLAMKSVFKEHANKVAVSSTKSMTGHLLGAAAGIEFVACVMAMQQGIIPPTINLDNPGEGCDLDFVPHVKREAKINVFMSNSLGFGGHNATLIARRYE